MRFSKALLFIPDAALATLDGFSFFVGTKADTRERKGSHPGSRRCLCTSSSRTSSVTFVCKHSHDISSTDPPTPPSQLDFSFGTLDSASLIASLAFCLQPSVQPLGLQHSAHTDALLPRKHPGAAGEGNHNDSYWTKAFFPLLIQSQHQDKHVALFLSASFLTLLFHGW